MSWCASFNGDFWEGYRSIIPEAPGFKKRRALYEWYHIANHAVLFGSGYLGQAEQLLTQLTRGM
jgi:fructosamine-3-kinase